MEAASRPCLCCKKVINLSIGRKDRKFCDEVCKNRYHNTQNYNEQQEIKRIQLILKKNRRILKKMQARKDNDEIPKERLLKEGFEFDYHTHLKNTINRNYVYTFCFDFGYRPVKATKYIKDCFKVVKAFDYKEE